MNIVEEFVRRYGRLPTEFDKDYLELLRMGKYRVLTAPELKKPSKCSNCGSTKEDRKYVDFGLEIDWYGIVYLCTLCLTDVAKNSGIFDDITSEMRGLVAEVKDKRYLEEQGERLHTKMEALFLEFKDYYDSLRSIRNKSDFNSDSDMGTDEIAKESDEHVRQVINTTTEPKPRSTKSTASRGSSSPPSLEKLLNANKE